MSVIVLYKDKKYEIRYDTETTHCYLYKLWSVTKKWIHTGVTYHGRITPEKNITGMLKHRGGFPFEVTWVDEVNGTISMSINIRFSEWEECTFRARLFEEYGLAFEGAQGVILVRDSKIMIINVDHDNLKKGEWRSAKAIAEVIVGK